MNNVEKYNEQIFENIKHVNEYGQEFWYARELQVALEYAEWRKFTGVIQKAMDACAQSGNEPSDHFVGAAKIANKKSRPPSQDSCSCHISRGRSCPCFRPLPEHVW